MGHLKAAFKAPFETVQGSISGIIWDIQRQNVRDHLGHLKATFKTPFGQFMAAFQGFFGTFKGNL